MAVQKRRHVVHGFCRACSLARCLFVAMGLGGFLPWMVAVSHHSSVIDNDPPIRKVRAEHTELTSVSVTTARGTPPGALPSSRPHGHLRAAHEATPQQHDWSTAESEMERQPGGGGRNGGVCPHIRPDDLAFISPFYGAHEWFDNDWEKTKAMILNPDITHCPDGSANRSQRKVFGLGLSKTGTTSLHAALNILGYRDMEGQPGFWDLLDADDSLVFHDPDMRQTPGLVSRLQAFFKDKNSRAATDFPLSIFFDELLQAFPTALFVMTTRELKSWYGSAKKQMSQDAHAPYNIRNRFAAYHTGKADHHMFPKAFVQHYKNVLRNVPCCQLLPMDIVGGQSWETLLPFIGHATEEVEGVDFPLRRVTPKKMKKG
mmetsp:Transcript_46621/g.130003  ORF Transcript_46621/g.130003 Transcript_46621/m.130003 type:complete len:373 (+) Transcript_46621:237-1355(+)